MRQIKNNHYTYWTVRDAVFNAVIRPVFYAVDQPVGRAVYWSVYGAVSGAVYWSLDRPVRDAVYSEVNEDPPHPGLQVFLLEFGAT